MKYLLRFFLFSLFLINASSQCLFAQNLLLNGSFETNNVSSSVYDVKDADVFDTLMPGISYISGRLSLRKDDGTDCSNAKDGDWFIAESNLYYFGAFSLFVPEGLQAGKSYVLTFNDRICAEPISTRWIDIGLSNDSSGYGDLISHISEGFDTVWIDREVIFTPLVDENFVTVKLLEDNMISEGGLQADNFYLIEAPTGIAETDVGSFSVSPNPTSTTITLSLPSNQNAMLSIFNLLGEKVKEEKVTGKQVTLDVSSLPQGLYLVRTENRVMGKPTFVNTTVGEFVKE